MTRCQHCKKLTHSEDLYVTFNSEDFEKIIELEESKDWIPEYKYSPEIKNEIGKLKCGDIYIHFVPRGVNER